MFAFGSMTGDGFVFVQTSKGHVYTYSSEKEARSYHNCVKGYAGLYKLDVDLSLATLVEPGDVVPDPPATVEPTEAQKLALYNSYPYKSLLFWKPIPEDIIPEVA